MFTTTNTSTATMTDAEKYLHQAKLNRERQKRWYEKNKEQHKANVKSRDKDPLTIRKRYIRELNNKVLDSSKIKPETITKYYIQYDKNKDFYY